MCVRVRSACMWDRGACVRVMRAGAGEVYACRARAYVCGVVRV